MISQAAFAKQIGVTPQAVSKAVKAGRVPVYDATGLRVPADFRGPKFIRPDEGAVAFRFSRARLDDAAVADMAAELDRELAIEPDDAPPARGQQAPAAPATLVGAKTAKEELQADLLRLRLQRERGELISRQTQLDAFETAGRTVGRLLVTMPAWAEELNAAARSGGVPALTAWLRAKAGELCLQAADIMTASTPPDDADSDPDAAD